MIRVVDVFSFSPLLSALCIPHTYLKIKWIWNWILNNQKTILEKPWIKFLGKKKISHFFHFSYSRKIIPSPVAMTGGQLIGIYPLSQRPMNAPPQAQRSPRKALPEGRGGVCGCVSYVCSCSCAGVCAHLLTCYDWWEESSSYFWRSHFHVYSTSLPVPWLYCLQDSVDVCAELVSRKNSSTLV